MDLHLLGAAGTVTGSRTLITTDGATVLVDCGLFQGYKALRERNWRALPIDPRGLDAVLLTHAHIDHSGYLPRLVQEGFSGPVWCTEGTADLCRLLLPDSGYLQEEDARFANKRGYSKHRPAAPLYTQEQARASLELLRPVPWAEPVKIGPLTATFHRAGHILGASMVHLRGPTGSVLITGDLGRPNDPLMLPPAEISEPPDLLVLESTYGDRSHGQGDPLEQLHAVVSRTIARDGVVLIPTFAVGRAQSVLLGLHRLIEHGRLPRDLPIFLNSPMAVNATELYQRHADLHRLSPTEIDAVANTATLVRTADESRQLNQRQGPMVILSAAGMLTGGRVLHHLKAFAPDPRNTLLLAGFQAGGTRGASIAAGATSVKIHGEQVPIACEVERIDAWSAHADADEILAWLGRWPHPPEHVLLNHGEPEASEALRRRIVEELGWSCSVGELGSRVDVGDASTSVVAPEPTRAPAPPLRHTPTDNRLQSLGAERALVVLGGSGVPTVSDAKRRLTRAALATSENPENAGARRALRSAERQLEHAQWHDQARALVDLASEASDLALVCGTGSPLDHTLRDAARERGVPFIASEADALRSAGLPAATGAVVIFPGDLTTLATVYAVLERALADGTQAPIVFMGRKYWSDVLDIERLEREGLLDGAESVSLRYADSADLAWSLIRERLDA